MAEVEDQAHDMAGLVEARKPSLYILGDLLQDYGHYVHPQVCQGLPEPSGQLLYSPVTLADQYEIEMGELGAHRRNLRQQYLEDLV